MIESLRAHFGSPWPPVELIWRSLGVPLGSLGGGFGALGGPLGVPWSAWVLQECPEALKRLLLDASCESLAVRMVVLLCVFDGFQ